MQWLNPKTGGAEICQPARAEYHWGTLPPGTMRRFIDGQMCSLVRCVHTGQLTWVPDSLLTEYLGDKTPAADGGSSGY